MQTPSDAILNPQFKWGAQPKAHSVYIVEDLYNFLKSKKCPLASYDKNRLQKKAHSVQEYKNKGHTHWVILPSLYDQDVKTKGHNNQFESSSFGLSRDAVGSWWRGQRSQFVEKDLNIIFHAESDSFVKGALLGLGLADYKYIEWVKPSPKKVTFWISQLENSVSQSSSSKVKNRRSFDENISQTIHWIKAFNLSRHLSNVPANELHPKAFSDLAKNIFKKFKNLKVKVYGPEEVKKEKMGLLYGVGAGSEYGSYLVHIRYRGASKSQPLAFVGKGVTFDTGGLNIKPSSGMRLMKKDMSGASTVFGLAYFVALQQLDVNCDFYLALAENAISQKSTHPGDIHIARSGHTVEIHNTDAEGRLVMADAIDLAVTQKGKDKPQALIDVSTLTGAMRVAVGLDIAGYFTNSDEWAEKINHFSQVVSEPSWRMPLFKKYKNQLQSHFADLSNASDTGYGSAISAALFLENFVKDTPWVHFDVMSWNLSPQGPFTEGGNSQCFQILAELLVKAH